VYREKEYIFHPNMLPLPVGGRKETPFLQLSGFQTHEGGDAGKEVTEDTQDYNEKGVLFQPDHSRRLLHGGAPKQDRGTAAALDTSGGSGRSHHNGTRGPAALPHHEHQTTGQSVRAPNVNSLPLDKILKVVVMIVQQIMRRV
jgi:hypothetical protein